MRYIGVLLMSGTLIAGGFFAADHWRDRLEFLQKFRQMVYHLKNRMLIANESLPDALENVGMRFRQDQAAEFFRRTGERLKREHGAVMADVWQEEVEETLANASIDRRDRENLLTLGQHLGYADRSMQERTILFYLEQTDDSIEQLKGELETKTRLFRCLGMTAGLFLLVLLA